MSLRGRETSPTLASWDTAHSWQRGIEPAVAGKDWPKLQMTRGGFSHIVLRYNDVLRYW
jgi:hypothetical protein